MRIIRDSRPKVKPNILPTACAGCKAEAMIAGNGTQFLLNRSVLGTLSETAARSA